MLPFTHAQFLGVFARYNQAIWPAQAVAILLGLMALAALRRPSPLHDRAIAASLAAMWAWTGVAYHALFFSAINKAAYAFAAAFVLESLLLAVAGWRGKLRFGGSSGPGAWLAGALITYASVLYPLLGYLAGFRYPEMPMFGVTPCPVTIFTLGVLLLARAPLAAGLLVVPFAWSLVGGSAAFLLQVPQDLGLLFSGIAAAALVVSRRFAMHPPARH